MPPTLSPISDSPAAAALDSRSLPYDEELTSPMTELLVPGDQVGQCLTLNGSPIDFVCAGSSANGLPQPAKTFEVVKRLGFGSYATVYLVRENIKPTANRHVAEPVRRRHYALKCLAKDEIDGVAVDAQMAEVTNQNLLPFHPNIVTLYRVLSTPSSLLLLMEYVPGYDLFDFLDKNCDCSVDFTPIENPDVNVLLSRRRLHLLSSMFSQMCDAVEACHAHKVFHRDIKPENFMVTPCWMTTASGKRKCKVVVKLMDFGLSTTEVVSTMSDVGSRPYMSYECRNNVASSYCPRGADIWSLGIVLLNMIYHCAPWNDSAEDACPRFEAFLNKPIEFFMHRFTGMNLEIAEFLVTRVFCILDDPEDDSQRIGAAEFGDWARRLPVLLRQGSDIL